MREKIIKTYNQKAGAYLEVLDEFDKNAINYILLNLLVPDENPGDMDILVYGGNTKTVAAILMDFGFVFYTKYDKGQTLWNKYLKGIGFVQFHLYESLCMCGHSYFPLQSINDSLKERPEFHFYIFLTETLYKAKLRAEQFRNYKDICSIEKLFTYVKEVCPKSIPYIGYVIDCYENNVEINTLERSRFLWKNRQLNKLGYYTGKATRRMVNLFRKDNLYVLFVGVDGAGKSTLVEEVYKIFSKGGVFPVQRYMGLKNSLFAPKEQEHKGAAKVANEKNDVLVQKPLTPLRFCKILLYWAEYNLKYLYTIGLHPYGSRTAYLIDRCYLDLLFFYPYPIVRFFLFQLSFIPQLIIFLSGNEDALYERKREMSKEKYHILYTFYMNVANQLASGYKKKVLKVNTTQLTIEAATHRICDFIME